MGKTAFALNIAHNVAYQAEEPVAIFSLEMPASQLVQRIICSMGGIEGSTMRTGEIYVQMRINIMQRLKESVNVIYT